MSGFLAVSLFMHPILRHEPVVWQHNRLAEARYKMSPREQKLLLYVISMIEVDDEEFKSYDINIGHFATLAGLDKNSLYSELRELAGGLLSKKLEIPKHVDQKTGCIGVLITNWLSSAFVSPNGQGTFSVKISPDLKPYLLQVRKEFYQFKLHQVMQMRSGYAIRLYQWLKRWQYRGKVVITVPELRITIGAEEVDKSVGQYTDFRKRAIIPAIAEIIEKTDIAVTFVEIKKPGSKAIGSISFTIASKGNPQPAEVMLLPSSLSAEGGRHQQDDLFPDSEDDATERLLSSMKAKYGLTERQVKKVREYHNEKGAAYILEQMSYVDSGKPKNAAASLLAALRDEWKAPVKLKPTKRKVAPVKKEVPPEGSAEIAQKVAASLGAFRKELMQKIG